MPRTQFHGDRSRTVSYLFIHSVLPVFLGLALLFKPQLFGYGSASLMRMLVSPPPVAFHSGESVSLVDFIGFAERRVRKAALNEILEPIVPLDTFAKRRKSFLRSRLYGRKPGSVKDDNWNYGAGREAMLIQRSVLESEKVKRLRFGAGGRAGSGLRWIFCGVGKAGEMVSKDLGDARRVGELSVRDRERWLSDNEVLRWILVKDPWTRTVQFWLDGIKHSLHSDEYRKFMAIVRGRNLTDTEKEVQKVSLPMFFLLLARQKSDNLDNEVMPIIDYCAWRDVSYNVVAHWEKATDDLAMVSRKLEADFTKSIMHITEEQKKWAREQRFLNKANVRKCKLRANKLYKQDMEAFGYRAEAALAYELS